MSSSDHASPPRANRTQLHRRRVAVAVVVVAALTIIGFAVQQSLAAASQAFAPVSDVVAAGVISTDDGYIAEGESISVSDDHLPAIAGLDDALLDALRRAAADAASDGVEVRVNSGWRSLEYQEQLRQDAVVTHGSEAEAARWVAAPADSEHVTGLAVDLGPWAALDWLVRFGADYGLCQVYQNEPWHYELRPDAAAEGCPQMYDDPTSDPRMAQ